MLNASKHVEVRRALVYVDGAADRTGEIFDTQRLEGVQAVVQMGTIATGAVTALKLEHGDESNLSDAEDVAGAVLAPEDTDDDQLFILDLPKPIKRYVRLYVDKDGINNSAESAIYLGYGAHRKPVENAVADEVTQVMVIPA